MRHDHSLPTWADTSGCADPVYARARGAWWRNLGTCASDRRRASRGPAPPRDVGCDARARARRLHVPGDRCDRRRRHGLAGRSIADPPRLRATWRREFGRWRQRLHLAERLGRRVDCAAGIVLRRAGRDTARRRCDGVHRGRNADVRSSPPVAVPVHRRSAADLHGVPLERVRTRGNRLSRVGDRLHATVALRRARRDVCGGRNLRERDGHGARRGRRRGPVRRGRRGVLSGSELQPGRDLHPKLVRGRVLRRTGHGVLQRQRLCVGPHVPERIVSARDRAVRSSRSVVLFGQLRRGGGLFRRDLRPLRRCRRNVLRGFPVFDGPLLRSRNVCPAAVRDVGTNVLRHCDAVRGRADLHGGGVLAVRRIGTSVLHCVPDVHRRADLPVRDLPARLRNGGSTVLRGSDV